MGKIADRFSRKNDPLYAVSKHIITLAHKSCLAQEEDYPDDYVGELADEVLENELRTQFECLNRTEFENLLSLIIKNAESKPNGTDILNEIYDSISFMCQNNYPTGETPGHLVSIPLSMTSNRPIWEIQFDELTENSVIETMKEFELVADDAKITFLPRILSSVEGQIIGHHDTYFLMQLLAKNEKQDALKLVQMARVHGGLPETAPHKSAEGEMLTFGSLVAYVESIDVSPFPLSDELKYVLNEIYESEPDSEDADPNEVNDEKIQSAMADVAERLKSVSNILSEKFGVSNLLIIQSPESWDDGVSTVASFERTTVANMQVMKFLKEVGGMSAHLCYDEENISNSSENNGLNIPFCKNAPGFPHIGFLFWPALFNEDIEECNDELSGFLSRIGIDGVADGRSCSGVH